QNGVVWDHAFRRCDPGRLRFDAGLAQSAGDRDRRTVRADFRLRLARSVLAAPRTGLAVASRERASAHWSRCRTELVAQDCDGPMGDTAAVPMTALGKGWPLA